MLAGWSRSAAAPGNRNDVAVARHTLAHLLAGDQTILATQAIGASTRSPHPGLTTADELSATSTSTNTAGSGLRVEHVIARLKDWPVPRQCRRRRHAINRSLQISPGLQNLNTRTQQLRVIS